MKRCLLCLLFSLNFLVMPLFAVSTETAALNDLTKLIANLLKVVKENKVDMPQKLRQEVALHAHKIYNIYQIWRNDCDRLSDMLEQLPVNVIAATNKQILCTIPDKVGPFAFEDFESMMLIPWFEGASKEERIEALNYFSDELILEKVNFGKQFIQSFQFHGNDALSLIFDKEKGIDFGQTPEAFKDLLQILLDFYFSNFSYDKKINLLIELLNLPMDAGKEQVLMVFLKQSGPVLQKFFQLVSEYVQSRHLKGYLDQLKENIPGFSFDEAKIILERTLGKPYEEVFSELDKTPVAAATVGQVHLGKLKLTGEEVAVKIRRPQIKKNVHHELKIIRSFIKEERILKLYRRLEKSIWAELNFLKEGKNINEGQFYSNKDKNLYAVKLIGFLPSSEEVLIMSKAEGKSLSRFREKEDLVKISRNLKHLYKKWIKNAVFGSGFFHADLHAGNIFYQNEGQYKGALTLLDFGSVGRLSQKEQKSILKIAIGMIAQRPELIMKGFRPFEKMNCEEAIQFHEKLIDILIGPHGVIEKTNLILGLAYQFRFEMSRSFLQFSRGKVFLEDHIIRNNKMLEEFDLGPSHVQTNHLFVKVFISQVPSALFSWVNGYKNENPSILDHEILSGAWKFISGRYFNRELRLADYNVCRGRAS